MKFDPTQYRAIFCDEAAEHAVAVEAALLRMEADPAATADAVDTAFRAAHTIKGGADAIGFPGLARFTHGLEELLSRLRGVGSVPRHVLDLLLEGGDTLGRYLAACKVDAPPPPDIDALLARFKAEASGSFGPPAPPVAPVEQPAPAPARGAGYAIAITPHLDALKCGLDPLRLLRALTEIGTVGQVAMTATLPALADLDPESCFLSWSVVLETGCPPDVVHDVFEFAREQLSVDIRPLTSLAADGPRPAGAPSFKMGRPLGAFRARYAAGTFAGWKNSGGQAGEAVPDPIALAVSLVDRGALTAGQALDALDQRRLSKPALGGIAVEVGYLRAEQLFEIQAEVEGGQPFALVAMQHGHLSEDMLAKLFLFQELSTPPLTEVLLAAGLLSTERLSDEVTTYRSDANASAMGDHMFVEIPALPPPPDASMLDEYGPMIGEFCQEADEHLEAADRHLLTIDGDPTNADALNAVYRGFHTIKGVSSMLGLGVIQTLAHEAENLLNLARDGKVLLKGKPLDVVFVSTDALKRQVRYVRKWAEDRVPIQEDPALAALLADLRAVGGGDVAPAGGPGAAPPTAPAPAPVAQPVPLATARPSEPMATVTPLESAPPSPAHPEAPSAAKHDPQAQPARPGPVVAKETVRVDKDRLDKLINTIGELVIAQSMAQQEFDQMSGGSGAQSLALPELSKISRDLQELSLSLRMVPLQGTFQKMSRLVRDLSRKMDKPVELELHGEETELDKTVVDQLGDPLMHMVRNAVDHGLEGSAEERLAAGKSAEGRVRLSAYHQGGSIYIELADDGRGMDRERLIRKATEKGIIPDGARLSDAEAYALIFAPGFSTAKQVTDVSGRGVGMDVVRRNVEALQGNILIDTVLGKGTTFTIRLPLTLAIMDGLTVGLGDDVYVLPLLSVIESFRPRPSEMHAVAARGEAITVRGEVVPLLRLHQLLGRPTRVTDPCQALVVLVEDQGRKYAILVDELLGQMQAVVKSLDANYRRVDGLAGATILGDGRVAMILDINGLTKLHTQRGGHFTRVPHPLDTLGELA